MVAGEAASESSGERLEEEEEGDGGDGAKSGEEGVDEAWVLAEVEGLREAVTRLTRDKERLLGQLSRSAATAATTTTTNTNANANTTVESFREQEEGDPFEAEDSARSGCGAYSDEREGDYGGGGEEEEQHLEEQEDEEEALLMPRGGPAPIPSRFTPRSSKASLGASGGGWAAGAGAGAGAATRPLGRSVAAAALLRCVRQASRLFRVSAGA